MLLIQRPFSTRFHDWNRGLAVKMRHIMMINCNTENWGVRTIGDVHSGSRDGKVYVMWWDNDYVILRCAATDFIKELMSDRFIGVMLQLCKNERQYMDYLGELDAGNKSDGQSDDDQSDDDQDDSDDQDDDQLDDQDDRGYYSNGIIGPRRLHI